MLDIGNYSGRIKRWGMSESKNGKARLEISVRLASQEDAKGDYTEMAEPVSRTVFLYLTPAAMPMTAAAIRSLGYQDTDFTKLDPDHEQAFDLTDVEVNVRVAHEEYNGETKEKVELNRGFSRKVKASALSGFDEINLAFKAAQEAEAKGVKGEASPEEAGRRRKKKQSVAAE